MQDFHLRYNKRFMSHRAPFEGDFVAYAFQGLKPWASLFALRAMEHSA
jgi:hypothetical protein